jgi:hypothetical protein
MNGLFIIIGLCALWVGYVNLFERKPRPEQYTLTQEQFNQIDGKFPEWGNVLKCFIGIPMPKSFIADLLLSLLNEVE